MKNRHQSGFTWVEAVVALSIIAILAALAMPAITCGPVRSPMTQTLSNAKQLHLATQQMALDGTTTGDTNLGWPGDTGGTFSNWVLRLTTENYLTTNDFRKLMSAPGVIPRSPGIPPQKECALLVYAVSSNSPDPTVFLTSANFTNTPTGGSPLQKTAKPYGNKGFVAFRKAGDGAFLLPKQVGKTNLIGDYVPLLR